jgi:NitT/TauT family transport system substrate-binding protein
MRLAINAPAAQVHAYRALQYGGLGLDDVQIEYVTFPEQLAALSNGAVDAVIALEPLLTLGRERGLLEPVLDMGYAMPQYPVSMLFYAADFIQSQPEAGRRFLVAYLRSLRYLEDATLKRKNWDEVVQLFIANTPVKDAALYERMGNAYGETDGNIGVEALEADQEFYLQHGMQRDRLNMHDLVDKRFAEYALQALGPYQ